MFDIETCKQVEDICRKELAATRRVRFQLADQFSKEAAAKQFVAETAGMTTSEAEDHCRARMKDVE